MPSLLIKELPADVHAWLKKEAQANRRSMPRQASVILKERMHGFRPVHFGTPLKTRVPITRAFMDEAKNDGRP
jgi:plasmid stability protein